MKLCVYTVDTTHAYQHMWNKTRAWAVYNRFSFSIFDRPLLDDAKFHNTWEKVSRAQQLLNDSRCKTIMWIDSDAIINNPYFRIERILNLYRHATVIGGCNSLIGNGLKCDASCCHIEEKKGCVQIHDIGSFQRCSRPGISPSGPRSPTVTSDGLTPGWLQPWVVLSVSVFDECWSVFHTQQFSCETYTFKKKRSWG